jgi:hypothetical protein
MGQLNTHVFKTELYEYPTLQAEHMLVFVELKVLQLGINETQFPLLKAVAKY